MRMSENRMLSKVLGAKRGSNTRKGKITDYNENFRIFLFTQYHYGGEIKEHKMGRIYNMHEGCETYTVTSSRNI